MTTFDTPGPITLVLDLGAADVRVAAGERAETVVEVRPSDTSRRSDVVAAEQARVEYAGGRLLVKAPKTWRQYSFVGDGGAVDVQIELPAGSSIEGTAGVAAFRCTGPLGECRLRAGVGDIQVDRVGASHLSTGAGDVIVERAGGHLDVATGSGAIRVGAAESTLVVKNSNGECWIGESSGDLRVRASNGAIRIDRAAAGVGAKTANGDIRIGEVGQGAVVTETAYGEVDIGIPEGAAAWLDLHTKFGHVRNEFSPSEPPADGEATVSVRGRTAYGDIVIRRV